MNTVTILETDIRFKGFSPTREQRDELMTELDTIKRLVPENTTIIAMIDFDGDAFGCTFDLFLKNGSAYAFAEGSDVHTAIKESSHRLESKLRQFHLGSRETK